MLAGAKSTHPRDTARGAGRSLLLLGWLALALMLGAPATAQTPVAQPDAATHLLAPGDVLAIRLYDSDKPEPLIVQVDDAGQVVLPLVQTVKVGGQTPRAATELLTSLYRKYYVNPGISLLVQSYGQIEVFAFGADFPGRVVRLPSGARLLDLLSASDLSVTTLKLTTHSGEPELDPALAVPPAPQIPGQGSTAPPPLLASGAYRRLHLVRGGGAFDTLQSAAGQLPPVATPALSDGGAQPAGQESTEVVMPRPSDASLPLEHGLNWRRWIAARQADPASSVWVIDPLRITLEGELSRYNVALQDKDVLFVPAPEHFVDIKGVAKPGRYELLGEETLGSVMRLAGTPNYDHDLANAVINRYSSTGCLSRVILNLYPGLDDVSQIASFKLENRDRIGIFPTEQRVFVIGEVKQGGAFPFVEDSTVLDYVALAWGETPEANLAYISIIRQSRDRLDPGAAPEVIHINFKEIHAGLPSCTDFTLQPGDVVYVAPKGKEISLPDMLTSFGALVNGFAVAHSLTK